MKRLLVAIAPLLIAGSTLLSPSLVEASAPTASQLQDAAIQNAEASGWVHETVNASKPGEVFAMVNDIGASEGRQVVATNGAHARVLVVGGNAYIFGNAKAITSYFGLTQTNPQQFANRWLELTPSNPDYATVSAAVTLASDFGHVKLPGKLREGRVVTIDGHRALPIIAHVPATAQTPAGNATLYISATGKILPLEFQAVADGIKTTTKWSNWGHRVSLSVPPSASSLGG